MREAQRQGLLYVWLLDAPDGTTRKRRTKAIGEIMITEVTVEKIREKLREQGFTFTSEESGRSGERYTAEKRQRVQSEAIRFVELLSMDPETAEKIDRDRK
jgi:hypothetical protein